MFWLDFGARGRENIANSAVLFLVGAKNTVNYNVLGALWYLGVRSLWGRKGDHFLPHRELPNMKVALTGWGRYSGNNWGFNARCDIFGSGPCGAEKMIISCPTGICLVPGSIAGFAKPINSNNVQQHLLVLVDSQNILSWHRLTQKVIPTP